jgi:hypothetical protein
MAYTRKDSPTSVAGQPAVNFGGQIQDSNRVAVAGITNGILTNDATATPVVSPVAVSAGINTILKVPTAAISVTLIASAALNVSELSAFTQFATIPANTPVTIQLAKQKFLYMQGAATVSFFFNVLD